jgi:hypothetical protein
LSALGLYTRSGWEQNGVPYRRTTKENGRRSARS